MIGISRQFEKIKADTLTEDFARIVNGSPEDKLGSADGSSLAAPGEASDAMAPAQMGKQDTGPDKFGLMHTLGVLASIGTGWLLSAVVYTPFVHMRIGRGFLVASLETLLRILLGLLIGAGREELPSAEDRP